MYLKVNLLHICTSVRVNIPLFFFFLLITPSIYAQVLEIEISQIEELSEEYSLQWQQIENRLDYSISGEAVATARINPSLAYDLEFLDDGQQNEYEHSIYLSKEFRTPGHFRSLRDLRESRISLHEEQYANDRAEWLAATRFGFILIVLIERELEQIENLKQHLENLTEASARRSAEGEVSALENQLIEMSSYQLRARMETRILEKERLTTLWRTRMGFDDSKEIRLAGRFETPSVQIPQAYDLLALLDDSPQARANRMALESARSEVALEQNRRIPNFEISAGYKQLNPNWRGFLVGVAIPLPILSSNSETIAQARALERFEQTSLNLTKKERNHTTLQLLNALKKNEDNLTRFPEYLEQPEAFLRTLSISYEEGIQSLNDVLNTLSLVAESYQTKFSQLEDYYEIIMELEAITGQTFVHH